MMYNQEQEEGESPGKKGQKAKILSTREETRGGGFAAVEKDLFLSRGPLLSTVGGILKKRAGKRWVFSETVRPAKQDFRHS